MRDRHAHTHWTQAHIASQVQAGRIKRNCPTCHAGWTQHHHPTCPAHSPQPTLADHAPARTWLHHAPPYKPPVLAACDGTLTCQCKRCTAQRAKLVRHGHNAPRQPWEPVRRAA